MLSIIPRLIVGATFAIGVAAAQAQSDVLVDRYGPYLLIAGGANQYDYDCSFFYGSDCYTARSSAGKVAVGWRFARYAVEGWYADFGRARIRAGNESLRLNAGGVSGLWSFPFSPGSEALLRVGLVQTRHARSDDIGVRYVAAASAGLAVVLHLSRHVAMEVAWDATSGEGNYTGTALASVVTAGLRLTF